MYKYYEGRDKTMIVCRQYNFILEILEEYIYIYILKNNWHPEEDTSLKYLETSCSMLNI